MTHPLDIKIRSADPRDVKNGWARFLGRYPQQATVFHTLEWMRALYDAFGYEPKILLALDSGGVYHTAMPYMVETRFGIATNAMSMPFDTYGGPVGDTKYANALKATFLDTFDLFRVKQLTEYNQPGSVATELVDISPDINTLWNNLHKDTRTAIRSAEKHEVAVYASRVNRNLFDKVDTRLVSAILKHMEPSGLCRQIIAEYDSVPVAASLFFYYNGMCMYWANTVTDEGRRTNANYLLLWEAIQYAQLKGCTCMNLGASPGGADSLVKFKKGWGSTTHMYSKTMHVPVLLKPAVALAGVLQ